MSVAADGSPLKTIPAGREGLAKGSSDAVRHGAGWRPLKGTLSPGLVKEAHHRHTAFFHEGQLDHSRRCLKGSAVRRVGCVEHGVSRRTSWDERCKQGGGKKAATKQGSGHAEISFLYGQRQGTAMLQRLFHRRRRAGKGRLRTNLFRPLGKGESVLHPVHGEFRLSLVQTRGLAFAFVEGLSLDGRW